MTAPQKKVEPAELEAKSASIVTIEYRGENYVMPASLEDASGDVIDAIDEQKLSFALRALLGPDQWDAFKATHPRVRHYGEFFTEYAKAIGLPTVPE